MSVPARGGKKRGRPSRKGKGGDRPEDAAAPVSLVPCPGTSDRQICVESAKHGGEDMIPTVTEGTVCSGCLRNRSVKTFKRAAEIRASRHNAAIEAAEKGKAMSLRNALRETLINNRDERDKRLQGISDPLDVLDIMGLTVEDLGEFHNVVAAADEKGALLKLFDFLEEVGGSTFQAADSHTARWQCYLHISSNSNDTTLDPDIPVVKKLKKGLLTLQRVLSTPDTKVVGGKIKRLGPPLGGSGVDWTDPTVLWSRGKLEKANKNMPPESFVPQLYHSDDHAASTKAAFDLWRGNTTVPCGPVPYSVIINSTPGSIAVIKGCGLSHALPDGYHYDKECNHIDVEIKCGEMVAFRGDYVHAGSWYERNNTRIHLNLRRKDDTVNTNETHVEEQKVAPDVIVDEEGYNCKGDLIGKAPKRKRGPSKTKAKTAKPKPKPKPKAKAKKGR